MTFKAYLKIRCMNRPVISSIGRASTLLLRPIIAHADSSGATKRSTRDEEVFLYDFGLSSAEGTENTQYRRKQTGGDNNPLELR